MESIDKSLNPAEITNDLAQWLTRILNTRNVLPLRDLVFGQKRCWIICIDVMILGFRGNLYDSMLMAVRCALGRTLVPKTLRADTEDDIELDGDEQSWTPLDISRTPLSVTFNKIGLFYLVDASLSEELISESRINVVVSPNGSILALHKTSAGALPSSTLVDMIQSSSKVSKQLFQALDSFNTTTNIGDNDDKNSFLAF